MNTVVVGGRPHSVGLWSDYVAARRAARAKYGTDLIAEETTTLPMMADSIAREAARPFVHQALARLGDALGRMQDSQCDSTGWGQDCTTAARHMFVPTVTAADARAAHLASGEELLEFAQGLEATARAAGLPADLDLDAQILQYESERARVTQYESKHASIDALALARIHEQLLAHVARRANDIADELDARHQQH